MEMNLLFLITLSALFHAFYNFLLRKYDGSQNYLMLLFVVASICATILLIFKGKFHIPGIFSLFMVYLASVFYILYQVFVTKAYETGNIYSVYPLSVLSPVFIPLWAVLFLDERINIVCLFGILLSVCGAIMVKLNKLTLHELLRALKFGKEYKAARFAILASIMYSVGAIFDKARIQEYEIGMYVFLIIVFMTINLSILRFLGFSKKIKVSQNEKSTNLNWGLIGGIFVFFSFYTFRIALRDTMVSIAVPIRQISVIFAIILGILLLHERPKLSGFIGSLLIITGIVIINFCQ